VTVRTRFAPSPNGLLHLGHAYAALIAHDLARARGGNFVVRIENIDGQRSRAEWASEILADLAWLGLRQDGPVIYQSARLENYSRAAERLLALGLLYPCTCTRAEIAAQAAPGGPEGPLYPGTCRGRLDPEERWVRQNQNHSHSQNQNEPKTAWRLDLARASALAGPLDWHDENAGSQMARPELWGDVVLLRGDAPASYHLAATLDDATDGITLVTRGADLFRATHLHRLLQVLLGLPRPVWHHHRLLIGPDWRKLAKRRGSPALRDLRLGGADGLALAESLRQARFPAGLSLASGLQVCP